MKTRRLFFIVFCKKYEPEPGNTKFGGRPASGVRPFKSERAVVQNEILGVRRIAPGVRTKVWAPE